ncbi:MULTISPECIES: hypothetical protein [unclassified Aureimonas]|uniref:hypothetical protein n=1 Tax=unclassified Aureimonas TaxID=2615206 RepID=UPI0006F23AC3|nr:MULTISPECIES: hypothetical protein [unclassified Aureimonas]KQT62598.1 hypothetical protein ASG62_23070 [Aureimonas sp. Leaf427]KQT73177.1 hypothetical protein ASG54_17965 [Aureimonas sp. Leaf460]
MSNVPGISPITTDIEDVRHSDEDGFFGDEGDGNVPDDETDEDDDEARKVIEEGKGRTINP